MQLQTPIKEQIDYLNKLDMLWFKILPFVLGIMFVLWVWNKIWDRRENRKFRIYREKAHRERLEALREAEYEYWKKNQ